MTIVEYAHRVNNFVYFLQLVVNVTITGNLSSLLLLLPLILHLINILYYIIFLESLACKIIFIFVNVQYQKSLS